MLPKPVKAVLPNLHTVSSALTLLSVLLVSQDMFSDLLTELRFVSSNVLQLTITIEKLMNAQIALRNALSVKTRTHVLSVTKDLL
jgi:hypothetical protein